MVTGTVRARCEEEADAVAAALQQAEGAADLRDLVVRLSARLAAAERHVEEMPADARESVRAVREAEELAAELGERLARAERACAAQAGRVRVLEVERDAARDVGNAARAALLAEQSRTKKAERRALDADARVAAAEAQRDEARAAEDAACRREAATLRRLQTAEARLAQAGTAPPPRPALEAMGQVTGAEVCLWVRQTRALSALRGVSAERWDRDDAAPLRRLVYSLQQHAPGAGRAALSERALKLARALGGA